MFKSKSQMLLFLGGLGFGYVGGVLSAPDSSTLVKDSFPTPRNAQETNRPEKSSDIKNKLRRLETRVSALEEKIKAPNTKNVRSRPDLPPMPDADAVSIGAQSPSVSIIKREAAQVIESMLAQDDSPIRTQLGQIVNDEFENRQSEWRAMRQARGQARDEELLERMDSRFNLSVETRQALEAALSEEREEAMVIRRQARDDFDFKSARSQRRALEGKTDTKVEPLLEADAFEQWKVLREEARPPWRR